MIFHHINVFAYLKKKMKNLFFSSLKSTLKSERRFYTHALRYFYFFIPLACPLPRESVCAMKINRLLCVHSAQKPPHTLFLIRMMYKFSSSHISLFVEHEKVKRALSGGICKLCKKYFFEPGVTF